MINGLIQNGNNKVKPTKLDTNSRDYMNVKLNVKKKGSKNTILVMSDSHAKGCAGRLINNLNNSFNVMAIVTPEIVINTLTATANSNMDKLTVMMQQFFGVKTNDVRHDKSHDGVKHVINFVQSNSHANIITILCVPHRYNLADRSCVNKEINTFNGEQEKLMKTFKSVISKQIFVVNTLQDMVFI